MSSHSSFGLAVRPSTEPSIVRKYADLLSLGAATSLVREGEKVVGVGPMAALLHQVRGNGEAMMVGAGLGLVSITGGLVRGGIPVDLAAAVANDIMGIVACRSEFGVTFRNAGNVAAGVFALRMVEEWGGLRKKAGFHGESDDAVPVEPSMDIGDDPVVQMAQEL